MNVCAHMRVLSCTLAGISQGALSSGHHRAWNGLGKEKLLEVSLKEDGWGKGGSTRS